MHSVVAPLVLTLSALASLVATLFLVIGGMQYMTSSGRPDKLANAKRIIRNALIGLVVVLAAASITALLTNAYNSSVQATAPSVPSLQSINPASTSTSLVDVVIKAITGVLQNIIGSIAEPFLNALQFFTSATPLMAANPSVFNLWLAVLAIADTLFVVVVASLGFHLMSTASLGFSELEFKHLLPQLGLAFLIMNSSIFLIDTVISISNGMIAAIHAGFGDLTIWQSLSAITKQSASLGIAALLIMIVFVILSVILLVYYVGRLVTLYLGAALAPLVAMLWLLPSFKDFAAGATRTYLTTIFVLFVHVIILELAASLFSTVLSSNSSKTADPVMGMIVGLATIIALLKTQGVMVQLTYASIGPKALRRLSGHFVNGISQLTSAATAAAAEIG
jgi:hypothetical protein